MKSPRMIWRVIRPITIGLAFIAVLISSPALKAQGRSGWLSGAVDAQGVRHPGSDYPNYPKGGPWMDDAVKTVFPDYPYTARAGHKPSVLLRAVKI